MRCGTWSGQARSPTIRSPPCGSACCAERTPVDGPTVQVLAVADPANPYGSTLPWPKGKKVQRVGGAYIVLVDGEPALYVERSRKGLVTLPGFEQYAEHAIGSLRRLAE